MLVPGVHRSIRSLAAGEGPWPGTLVTDGEDVGVWCEIDSGECSIDWRFTGSAHVAAPTDVARSSTGHGALMPWCTTRVATFLARRSVATVPLEPGEWGTLVLSLLRGLREIADRAEPEFAGQWWLTDAGRPLCAPGGTTPARAGVVDILGTAQTQCPDRALRRILLGIQESVADAVPTSARVRAWERELLDFAAPRPLRLDEHPPRTTADPSIATIRAGALESPQRRRVRTRSRTLRSWCAQLLVRVRALMRRRERGRTPSGRTAIGREQTPVRSRRRVALVATAAAAAVLCAGLLWPGDEPMPSQAAEEAIRASSKQGTPTPSATTGDVEAGASPEGSSSGEDDPSASATAVLDALDDCVAVADDTCRAAIAADSTARAQDVLRSDAAGLPALVDDYGDLAVIRLGTDASGEQMLVLVRQNEKWLVRDVYDVADQPESG